MLVHSLLLNHFLPFYLLKKNSFLRPLFIQGVSKYSKFLKNRISGMKLIFLGYNSLLLHIFLTFSLLKNTAFVRPLFVQDIPKCIFFNSIRSKWRQLLKLFLQGCNSAKRDFLYYGSLLQF